MTPNAQQLAQDVARKRLRKARPLAGTPLNLYNTVLPADQKKPYRAWKQKYAPKDSGMDYDLRGAYAAGVKPDAKTGHWPDTYKKPNHPTFSNESQYAKYAGQKSGYWSGDRYIPKMAPRRVR